MVDTSYIRPPITEAVIEIRFTPPVESAQVEKNSAKFERFYPEQQVVSNVEFGLGIPASQQDPLTAQLHQDIGRRRSSSDLTQILVLWESKFVISQLAPYPGWDTFFQRFTRDWKQWKKAVGHRTITRIGVRYINRIDIPSTEPVVEHEAFLNVYPNMPHSLGPMSAYTIQAQYFIFEMKCNLTLNSAVVESPLLNHMSIIVDQDIARDAEPPQSEEDIYRLLHEIRDKKNRVFEDCITNRARELFRK